MAKDITVDKLTIGGKLTSQEVRSKDILIKQDDETYVSVKDALKKLPPTWIKSVNNILPDENGNVQIETGDKEYTAFEVIVKNHDTVSGEKVTTTFFGINEYDNNTQYTRGERCIYTLSDQEYPNLYEAYAEIPAGS